MSSISLAWNNLNHDCMLSNNGVQWAVFDKGGIARFNLSACLDSKSFNLCTHFLLKDPGEFQLSGNFLWQVSGNKFRRC